MPDGTLAAREKEKGTPQGSLISPLLANLFMHYAFDRWMDREHPGSPSERYADDIVLHCDSEARARRLRAAIAERLGSPGLELHPEKTKIVFCKDTRRRGDFEDTSFDFLGYTFRGRTVLGKKRLFTGFNPAISANATEKEDQGLASQTSQWHGPVQPPQGDQSPVRGWINYYGALYRSKLQPIARRIDQHRSAGPCRSSNDYVTGTEELGHGWLLFDSTNHDSSLIGTWTRAPSVGLWEPGEGRLSRRVLREPGGAIPPGHSPTTSRRQRSAAEPCARD